MVYIITEEKEKKFIKSFPHECYVHSWSFKEFRKHYQEKIFKSYIEAKNSLHKQRTAELVDRYKQGELFA